MDVLIESAYFSPMNIRRTSKALGLRSESSYRFERGADIGICDWAEPARGAIDSGNRRRPACRRASWMLIRNAEPKQMTLRITKSKDLLGIVISHAEECAFYLGQLGLKMPIARPGQSARAVRRNRHVSNSHRSAWT